MRIITDPKEKYQTINCLETYCLYRKTCANHTSAGDFRSEDGFSPELTVVNGDVHCKTREEIPFERESNYSNEWYPVNYDNLNRGLVLWTDIEKKSNE